MATTTTTIRRYEDRTRLLHWAVALVFLCAALTGLALFHPALYWFTALFGGGVWSRILHPYFGLVVALFFLFLFFGQWRDNVLGADDRRWLRQAPEMLRGRTENLPAAGKYNGGQKFVFWLMAVSLLVLSVTGFFFWHAWFPESPILLRRIGVVLHAFFAVVLVLTVIVHVYAAIWVKGTMRAMTRGTVTPGWVRMNHPNWRR